LGIWVTFDAAPWVTAVVSGFTRPLFWISMGTPLVTVPCALNGVLPLGVVSVQFPAGPLVEVRMAAPDGVAPTAEHVPNAPVVQSMWSK
jgi:hypothetical protein